MEILKFNELPPLAQKLLPLLLSNQKENLQLARMHFLSYLREKHNNPDFLADIALLKSTTEKQNLRYKGLVFATQRNRKYKRAWRRFIREVDAFLDEFQFKTPFSALNYFWKYGDIKVETFKDFYFIGSMDNIFIDGDNFSDEIKDNWKEFVILAIESLATYPLLNKAIEFGVRNSVNVTRDYPEGYLDFFANEFEPFAKKLFPECTFYYC